MIAPAGNLFAPASEEVDDIELYPWQAEAVEALRDGIRRRTMNQVLAAPTGSGKTTMAAYLIREAKRKGSRAVFIADRTNLIDQTSALFDRYGISHGVIQADHWRKDRGKLVQVASAQTLGRRGWPDTDLIVVDECHSLYANVTARIARRDVPVIGLSATPFTRGLGKLYDGVVTVRTTRQLLADGYLAPYRIFAASEPDMDGVKTDHKGEWDKRETETRAMPIIGDLVTEYLKHCEGKKFIAFGVNVAHCEEIQRRFMAAGVQCGLYTYHTGPDARQAMLRDFAERDGYLMGLVSVAALAKGFDAPCVEAVILARPLRNGFADHIQMIGRALRRDPENPPKIATILDHAGNCVRFWDRMNDFFENGVSELDDGRKKEKKAKAEKAERQPAKCPKCAHVHPPRPMCPACGFEYPRRSRVETVAGTLSELTGLPAGTDSDRQAIYSGLLYIALERGYAEGWAAHKYKERFGSWPNGLEKMPAPPPRALTNWVRSRMIAWAKGRAKAGV